MKQLSVSRFYPEKVQGALARAVVEDDVTDADLVAPEFWAHVAARLRRFQRVEVLNEAGRWVGEVCVADCGRVWARVVVVFMVNLEAPAEGTRDADPRAGYRIEFRAHERFRIRRMSDDAIIESGLATKRDAEARLDNYLKAVAA